MKKVGFFRSIRLKLILVFILLLLLAIQVIGSFFSHELENELLDNFKTSINTDVRRLNYYLEQAFAKERSQNSENDEPTLEEEVQSILGDFSSNKISKLQVIDSKNRVIGTNDPLDRNNVGKRITEGRITRSLKFGNEYSNILLDPETEHRTLVKVKPINEGDEVAGAIHLEASIEGVYSNLQEINKIFARGTVIAVIVSALLGILIARTITKPITEMRKQAKIMSTGDFSQKVNVYGMDEIGQLAVTFNEMNDKVKQAHMTTEEERRKLSSILSNMSDGVIATDETGAVTLMNDPASKLIGKTFHEIKGQSLIDVLKLDERIRDFSEIQDTSSVIIDFSDEVEFFLIRANFSIIQDEDEQINGFITVISDVTEQEKVEKERREFVSNVSHELRTPLTTMRSYLEALSDGAWEDKEIAPRFLDVTQNETDRMIRLVNDLLQLSKMDNKDYQLYAEKVDFTSLFHHVIDRFEMNKEEHITFERILPDEEGYVWIDKDKVIQVLDNIISNAIKYSPDGGTIRFKLALDKQKLTASVTDQGMGVSNEKLEKIFDRFYRSDKARSRKLGGTGLGLAISKELVEAHYGHIWANSQEGKGTTIFFTLPLIQKRGDES